MFVCLFFSKRLHQEAMCVRNHLFHFLTGSHFESGMWNHWFLPSEHKCHLAEAQRRGARWQRGGGDTGRRDVGPHTDSIQNLQGYCHPEEKGNTSGEKGARRRDYLQSGAQFPSGTYWETLEGHWHWYESFFGCSPYNREKKHANPLIFHSFTPSVCTPLVAPSIPPSISVCWSSEGVGVFSLMLKGGHPKAKLLWAAGGPTLSPLVSNETEEIGDDGQRELKSVCALETSTSLPSPTSNPQERQKNGHTISTCL